MITLVVNGKELIFKKETKINNQTFCKGAIVNTKKLSKTL